MTRTPSVALGGVNPTPTPYADLNALLAQLVMGLSTVLGDNLVGAYLHGSFAIGDFDEGSDVDFIVVTRRDITQAELPALEAMHGRLFAQPGHWTKHLDGSYAPREELRRWSPEVRDPPGWPIRPADWGDPGVGGGRPARCYPFLYLNNTSCVFVRSEHDNTQVVRWMLREKGVRLIGPDPKTLIDVVTPAALRAEVAEILAYVAGIISADPAQLELRWLQQFYVVFACRILQTLETGTVLSKRAAVAWARENLDPRWIPLIEAGWAGRRELPRGEAVAATEPARSNPADAAATRAFIQLALEHAAAATG